MSNQTPELKPNIRLLIHPDVFDTIVAETKPYIAEDYETGGVLIGRWLDDVTVLVLVATGAGEYADHRRLSFAVDTDHANAELDYWTKYYPEADYIGEWHKHPPSLDYPSSGDLYSAIQLMNHEDYPEKLINPIVVVRNGEVQVNFYYIYRHEPQFFKLERRKLKLSDIPQLTTVCPIPRTEVSYTSRSNRHVIVQAKATAWWDLPGGEQLLNEEKSRLVNAGYKVKVDEFDGMMLVTAISKKLNFIFSLTGNFPHNKPTVEITDKQNKPVSILSTKLDQKTEAYKRWNEHSHLFEICREIEHKKNTRQNLQVSLLLISSIAIVVILCSLVFFAILLNQGKTQEITERERTASDAIQSMSAKQLTVAASAASFQATQTADAKDNQAVDASARTATASAMAAETVIAITVQVRYATITAQAAELATLQADLERLKGNLTPAPTPGPTPRP